MINLCKKNDWKQTKYLLTNALYTFTFAQYVFISVFVSLDG